MFQYPEYQLFEETVLPGHRLRAEEHEALRRRRWTSACARRRALSAWRRSSLKNRPLELSGGQKRRIAIAGVIAMRPQVLILDEPTAGLDPGGCEGILRNVTDYRRETGSTVLFVTHSMDDAARIADRLIVFHDGGIAMDGTPEEVFSHAQELTAMGLDVPQPAAIAAELTGDRGAALPESIYTSEQLHAAVLAVAQERGERRMLKDITLGQFFPGRHHRPPPGRADQAASSSSSTSRPSSPPWTGSPTR